MARHEIDLAAGQHDRDAGDFPGVSDPSHGLAGGERGQSRNRIRLRRHSLMQRRAFDGSGTDGVAADSIGDEIHGDGLGQTDYGGLRRRIDETVRRRLDR
ncbi:hypothetical protein D3C73_1116260 [compost metagenome]